MGVVFRAVVLVAVLAAPLGLARAQDVRVPAALHGVATRPQAQPSAPDAAFADGMVISGATPHRIVHFTFDDGPDVERTPRLLDTLDELGIRATFFMLSRRFHGDRPHLRAQLEVAREVVRRGHQVAVHGTDHEELPSLDTPVVLTRLDAIAQQFGAAFGYVPRFYRPPHGTRSPRVDALLAERGFTTVIWNLNPTDYVARDAETVLQNFVRVLAARERRDGHRGGVVLLHDTQSFSSDAIRALVTRLRTRNCELLAQGEELYDIVDDLAFFHVPRGDAPATAVAPPATLTPQVLERRQARARAQAESWCNAHRVIRTSGRGGNSDNRP